MGLFDRFKKNKKTEITDLEKIYTQQKIDFVQYLKERITENKKIEDILNEFEAMCQIPLEDDMILFETGAFDFTGETLFYFSLVRQYPNEDEEYNQITVHVLYEVTSENEKFKSCVWNTSLKGNIFDYIRKSDEYAYAKKHEYVNVEIYLSET